MRAVAEGGIFGFAATAGPDGAVFLDLHGTGGFTGAFVRAVAAGRVFRLPTGAEVEGLSGLGVDLVGEGLPVHRLIIQQSLEKESGGWIRWKVEGGKAGRGEQLVCSTDGDAEISALN